MLLVLLMWSQHPVHCLSLRYLLLFDKQPVYSTLATDLSERSSYPNSVAISLRSVPAPFPTMERGLSFGLYIAIGSLLEVYPVDTSLH